MKPGELIVGGVNVTEEYGLFIQDRPNFTPPKRKIISNTNRVNKIIDDYEDVTMTLELIGRVQHRKTTAQRNEISLVREWQNELTNIFYKTNNDTIHFPYLDFIFYFDEAHRYFGIVENINYENKNWYDMYIQVEIDIRFKPYKYIRNNQRISLTTTDTLFSPDPYNNGQVPYNYISEPTIHIRPGLNISSEQRSVNIDGLVYIEYKPNEEILYNELFIWNEIKHLTTFNTNFNGGGPKFYKRFERPYRMSKTNGINIATVRPNWRTLI